MDTTPRADRQSPLSTSQSLRSGPVPLDPSWLPHVAGGTGEEGAPHGRWLPAVTEAGGEEAAPHGRW